MVIIPRKQVWERITMTLLDLNPILEKRKLSALKNGLVDSSDALKAINRECDKLCKKIIKEDKER